MLFYNSTTNKRYNERTLALYGFSQGDNDVHPLTVEYPNVDERYETYRDTQEVDYVDGQYHVRFEVANLPKDRVVENTRDQYSQALQVIRNQTIAVEGHEIQNPVTARDTLKAWAVALNNDLGFEPTESPFTSTPPTMTSTLATSLVAGIDAHLTACETVADAVDPYLEASDVAALKQTEPADWVRVEYDTLMGTPT